VHLCTRMCVCDNFALIHALWASWVWGELGLRRCQYMLWCPFGVHQMDTITCTDIHWACMIACVCACVSMCHGRSLVYASCANASEILTMHASCVTLVAFSRHT